MATKRVKKVILLIIGIALAILFLFPIVILLINSFKPLRAIYINVLSLPNSGNFTASNYLDAFERLDFPTSIGNSLLITVCGTLLIGLFSSMAAWVLVRYKSQISSTIFLIFAGAMLIPFQCVMIPLVQLMGKLHMLNRPGLIFMNIGFGCIMSIILLHGFIKNIPIELEEASVIDGCNMVQRFFLVVLPLLKSILVTVSILNVMQLWNDYLLPSLTINRDGSQTLPLKTFLFFGQFVKRWDLATAGLTMCIIPIVIFYIACQKYIVKGVTDGALKG